MKTSTRFHLTPREARKVAKNMTLMAKIARASGKVVTMLIVSERSPTSGCSCITSNNFIPVVEVE